MLKTMCGGGLVVLIAALGMQQAALTWADKAAEVLAETRKAIGGGRLDALQTFSAEGRVQRNVGSFQMNADLEMLLAMPDKYARLETATGGPMSFTSVTGFNGERSLRQPGAATPMGGAMVIRMGPGGPLPGGGEKLTLEQREQGNKAMVRSARHDISRLMLGWFGMTHPSIAATYAYAGEADSPDGRAHVIDVKDADGFAARLFIDDETHLPLMLTYQGPRRVVMTSAGGRGAAGAEAEKRAGEAQKHPEAMHEQPPVLVEYHLYFSDWSSSGGIKFPRRIQRAIEGTTEEEWEITRIQVNPQIDAKKFDVEG